jgi:tRNA(His) guanylyltransferase
MSDELSLGDRMKFYEGQFSLRLKTLCPIIARIDGKCFHSWTKGLERPYCSDLSSLFVKTCQHLMDETNATCGYTQSDEISLAWITDDVKQEIFMGAKLQKMVSVLSSLTTAYFNEQRAFSSLLNLKPTALFDCRVFEVPTRTEACNHFVWREQDATRNSVQMAARSVFSHKQCDNKNGKELMEMLFQAGINWNDFPDFFKRGTYVRKLMVERPFTTEEIEKLPARHEARSNPELVVRRTVFSASSLPVLTSIINRELVLFAGHEPITGGVVQNA